jgi:nucleoside-diphosphate-sugar epimerase
MSEKQKLLLVGCGDIPNRLISKLKIEQWKLQGLRRSPIEMAGVDMTFGDAADPEIVDSILQKKPDQLLICLTPDARNAEAYEQSYLKPVQAICASAQKWAPQCHLIFVSSTSVYAQDSGELIDEQSAAEPMRDTAKVLVQAEHEITQSNNPWSIVRFSGIYGPDRERLLAKVSNAQFAEPENASWTNRIHSEDCAGVLAHLLENTNTSTDGAGLLVATDNESALNTEVEKWLAGEMGIEYPDFDTEDVLVRGKRCSNRSLLESGYKFLYPSYREGYRELIRSGNPAI